MSKNVPPGISLEIVVGESHYSATLKDGCTISDVREFCILSGVAIPENAEISVFTLDPTATNDSAILEREEGVLTRPIEKKHQILHGWKIKVGASYILSQSDILVSFQ